MNLRIPTSYAPRTHRYRFLLAATSLAISCGSTRGGSSSEPSSPAETHAKANRASGLSPSKSVEHAPDLSPVLIIDGRDELIAIAAEKRLGFAALLGLSGPSSSAPISAFSLPTQRVGTTGHGGGAHFSKCRDGSLQDWLSQPDTAFELVGITNRIDQRENRPGTCGDLRFVFRLQDPQGARLPISFAVVYEQPDDGAGCRDVAQSWMQSEDASVLQLRDTGGPLSSDRLAGRLTRVELNGQSLNDADGRACNELAVFVPKPRSEGMNFELNPLDASPGWPVYNVGSRARLGLWLGEPETRDKVVAGINPTDFPGLVGKDRVAARNVLWWFALDGTREEFHPNDTRFHGENAYGEYSAVMRSRHFQPDSLPAEYPTVPALLHRLDGMTCGGCHARRSVGGFHLPGAGGEAGLVQARSPHLQEQLRWRAAYVAALASGDEPNLTRPLHNAATRPEAGSHCSMESSPLGHLRCDEGLSCVSVAGSDFGTCWPGETPAGGPCSASSPHCDDPGPWFPGGHDRSGELRATVPSPADLQACMSDADPWACAAKRAQPMAVVPCSESSSCRDGFACVAAPQTSTSEVGSACVPVASLREFRLWGRSATGA